MRHGLAGESPAGCSHRKGPLTDAAGSLPVNANRLLLTVRALRAFAAALLLLACSNPAPAQLVRKLPAVGRTITWSPSQKTLAVSMALGGVAFFQVEQNQVTAEEFHPEWKTLFALPLTGGGYLLADRFSALRRIQPSATFGKFSETGNWACEGIPTHLIINNGVLLVAAGGSGLLLYDWQDNTLAPRLRGRFPFVDYTKEIALDRRGFAVLADNFETGLQIVDQREILRPKLMALRSGGFCDSVAVQGELLAVANRSAGIQFWTIGNPSGPAMFQAVPPDAAAGGTPGVAKSVDFSPMGLLVACEGSSGAYLFEPTMEKGGFRVKHRGVITPLGVTALDAVFLSEDLVAVTSEKGELYFCKVPATLAP